MADVRLINENTFINKKDAMYEIKALAKEIARQNGGVDDITLYLKEAYDRIATHPTIDAMPRWISVEERLPEEHADGSVDAVLVTDGEFTHMAYYVQGQWVFCESGEMKEPMWNTVNYWMPLPPMPKEET